MVCVVHAAGLDLEIEAFLVARQDLDRLRGHLGQARLVGAVGLVLHVGGLEEPEHRPLDDGRVDGVEVGLHLGVGAADLLDEVAPVPAHARLVLGIGHVGRDEVTAAAAHSDVDHAALHLFGELDGDVGLRAALRDLRVVLPVSVRGAGIMRPRAWHG